jgi:hypothetical protein
VSAVNCGITGILDTLLSLPPQGFQVLYCSLA